MKFHKIFSRSFNQYEKNFGYGLIIGSFIIVWSICTIFFHYSDPITVLNLQQLNRSTEAYHRTALASAQKLHTPNYPIEFKKLEEETKVTKTNNLNNVVVGNVNEDVKQIVESNTRQDEPTRETEARQISITRPSCNTSESRLSHCRIKGNIKIQGNSSTIFIPLLGSSYIEKQSWTVIPYVRKESAAAMHRVKKWHVNSSAASPTCTQSSNIPAILFSVGGFSGNTFHDFSDIIVPLYLTSKNFNGEVQFLISDYKPWWVNKFRVILRRLSNYEIVNVDSDQEVVRCFEHLTIGLEFHKEFSIDPSRSPNGALSMTNFKTFLRGSFSLNRTKAMKVHNQHESRPRLVIISRKRSRSFTNQDKIVKMATRVGYDVVVAEARLSTNLSEFARMMNSGDVLMGVHGAGLTNMVFLPENAVVIQIIPFGNIDGLARRCFREPAKDMDIKYLEYKIRVEESTLLHQFLRNHSIFRDPLSVNRQGWEAVKSIYLDKQNVRLDVRRFRAVLLKALKLLHE